MGKVKSSQVELGTSSIVKYANLRYKYVKWLRVSVNFLLYIKSFYGK